MDATRPACSPQPRGGGSGFMRSIAKLVRRRHAIKRKDSDSVTTYSGKIPSENYDTSSVFSQHDDGIITTVDEEKSKEKWQREAMEALLATVFAGVSGIKASYAELQLAQSPYDPEAIESSDHTIVADLKRLSQLKHFHLTKSYSPVLHSDSVARAHLHEQRNLVKTFEITQRKLQSDIHRRDTEVTELRQRLYELAEENRYLESKLRTQNPLSGFDGLRFSDLNATHFVSVLQYTTRAIRTFVRKLEKEMEAANWDLGEAAAAVVPGVACGREAHRSLAFESFVCKVMFDGFHQRHFGLLPRLPQVLDRSGFFREFLELKEVPLEELLRPPRESAFGFFLRAKFEALVHPNMERAFFGRGEKRAVLCSGEEYPTTTAFFSSFAEMAKRVWALHRLFWSFDEKEVFIASAGSRFSDVHMVSAAAPDDLEAAATVAFAVSPGFRIGGVVLQCRVYLERRRARGNGRL